MLAYKELQVSSDLRERAKPVKQDILEALVLLAERVTQDLPEPQVRRMALLVPLDPLAPQVRLVLLAIPALASQDPQVRLMALLDPLAPLEHLVILDLLAFRVLLGNLELQAILEPPVPQVLKDKLEKRV